MKTVIVSTKYQIVIPRDLCRQLNIQVGQKLKARIRGDHIELVPEPPLTAARGFLPGLDAKVERDVDIRKESSARRAGPAPSGCSGWRCATLVLLRAPGATPK